MMRSTKKFRQRKGQVESQFAWIFILIAGAVILFFFFSVVGKQRETAKQRLAVSLSADFEAILSSAAVAKGASQLLPIFSQAIDFSCTDQCACSFGISGVSKSFRDK